MVAIGEDGVGGEAKVCILYMGLCGCVLPSDHVCPCTQCSMHILHPGMAIYLHVGMHAFSEQLLNSRRKGRYSVFIHHIEDAGV